MFPKIIQEKAVNGDSSPHITNASVELMVITPGAEDIIERACRTCYLSFFRYDPPKSTEELIKKILLKKHFSVLEHASATFRIEGGSRVFTHELVRHRFISPSQESQRYVVYADKHDRKKTTDFQFVMPETIANAQTADKPDKAARAYEKAIMAAYETYEQLLDAGVPPEDARYVLPNATVSQIVITANFRELRHFFCVRTHPRAHWEIREIALKMLEIMQQSAPIVFGDFRIDEGTKSASFEFET
ncbi:MAG TPA: FAD-dependent thymidylate synthase [candidate division Zixibacteria bacterium]|nr:FAD-dependent thymidylate synthase [candidate division Zixibacteria bacterium]HBZ02170.1 FAD-dependent thymidylate synthase [candidate division Zixibacteria bacterium]